MLRAVADGQRVHRPPLPTFRDVGKWQLLQMRKARVEHASGNRSDAQAKGSPQAGG